MGNLPLIFLELAMGAADGKGGHLWTPGDSILLCLQFSPEPCVRLQQQSNNCQTETIITWWFVPTHHIWHKVRVSQGNRLPAPRGILRTDDSQWVHKIKG